MPRTTSYTALQNLCEAMPHITNLSLTSAKDEDRFDGVLRSISTSMHLLKSLNICGCTVDPKAIEYLLPTEDNALGGCPQLVVLDLRCISSVDVKLLKKIILALPKLRILKHELIVNALGNLTEEEMGADTARHLIVLCAMHNYNRSSGGASPIRFDSLAKSPAFQRIKNNITTVDIHVPIAEIEPQQSALAHVLMCLPKLKCLKLSSLFAGYHDNVIPFLESIGNRLEYLYCIDLSANLSVYDVMRTCRNIVKLDLILEDIEAESLQKSNNLHHDQVEKLNNLPVLNYLTELKIGHLFKNLCSRDMLIALLQSPWLNKITLLNVEVLSDDVMWNVLSSGRCTALSKVTEFLVMRCPLITAAPLVHWLTRKNCLLQYLWINNCENVDCKSIRTAAEMYPRPLILEFTR